MTTAPKARTIPLGVRVTCNARGIRGLSRESSDLTGHSRQDCPKSLQEGREIAMPFRHARVPLEAASGVPLRFELFARAPARPQPLEALEDVEI